MGGRKNLKHQSTAVRMESQQDANQISEQVRAIYSEYGYTPVLVPAASVEERLAFIRSFVSDG